MQITTDKEASILNMAMIDLELLSVQDIKENIDDIADRYYKVIEEIAATKNRTLDPLIQQMTTTANEMSKHLIDNHPFTERKAAKVHELMVQDIENISHAVSEYNAAAQISPASVSPAAERNTSKADSVSQGGSRNSFITEANKRRVILNPAIPFDDIDMSKLKKSPR